MMRSSIIAVLVVAASLCTGCGGDDSSGQAATDSGASDASSAADTGGGADGSTKVDAGASDGGSSDGGAMDSGSADAGDSGATDGGGDGGDGGSADGGDGGSGDGGGVAPHTGLASVAGGVSAKSTSFKIVTTTGQSPGGNRSMSSPGYRLNGGVVGATQGQ